MAFTVRSFNNISGGAAKGMRVYSYTSSTDTLATVIADGYFNTLISALQIGDRINVKASDYNGLFEVTSVTTNVTVKCVAPLHTRVTLTSAQMLALRATPVTLVAAPGANRILELVSATLQIDYNSAAYAETTDNMQIKYTDGSGAAVSQTIETTGFIDQTADTTTNALPKIDRIVANSACENKALVLHNTGDGEWTTGNSPMVVDVYFTIATGV